MPRARSAVLLAPLAAAPKEVDQSVLDAQAQRLAAIKKVQPAVVAVCMHGGQGGGSGVVISADGYALTNFHVVQPTGPLMQCGLADGVLYDAVLVGLDKVGDVALIKLLAEGEGQAVPVRRRWATATRSRPATGRWRWATRSRWPPTSRRPSPSAWSAACTATSRPEGKGLLEYTDCIQIDTSINPGNSGGPLFNMKGELIGINGRGSFEKRGRVNSGVGYAISINQIKNFLGHLHAGLDTDHATLGAAVETATEDAPLAQMVVRQILDESRRVPPRPRSEGDQLVDFAGRPMTSTNQYKNILGIYPKDWRLPLTVRRDNAERQEVLVRLMGNMATEREQPPMPGAAGPRRPAASTRARPAQGAGEQAKRRSCYKAKKGYANYYFNELERDRLLGEFTKHGDFSPSVAGRGSPKASTTRGDQPGEHPLRGRPRGRPAPTRS